jgi:hypothetical protein
MSFYAATKKATEVMAHSYAHLYHLPITMFRFFTVYGPWGRPDMAHFKFTKAIIEGDPIEIYNHGKMKRDFTFIDDLVRGIVALIDAVPPMPDTGATPIENDSLSPVAPRRQHRHRITRPASRFCPSDRNRNRDRRAKNLYGHSTRRRSRHLGRSGLAQVPNRRGTRHSNRDWDPSLRRLVPRIL